MFFFKQKKNKIHRIYTLSLLEFFDCFNDLCTLYNFDCFFGESMKFRVHETYRKWCI